MQAEEIEQIAGIRVAVGFLGEKEQAGWWPSSFFATASAAFLGPLFFSPHPVLGSMPGRDGRGGASA
jgi:hypothetical protein